MILLGREQTNKPSDVREVLSPSLNDTMLVPQGEEGPSEDHAAAFSLESELQKAVHSCIDYCLERSIENPVEILRCAQHFLLCGRPLDVTDPCAP